MLVCGLGVVSDATRSFLFSVKSRGDWGCPIFLCEKMSAERKITGKLILRRLIVCCWMPGAAAQIRISQSKAPEHRLVACCRSPSLGQIPGFSSGTTFPTSFVAHAPCRTAVLSLPEDGKLTFQPNKHHTLAGVPTSNPALRAPAFGFSEHQRGQPIARFPAASPLGQQPSCTNRSLLTHGDVSMVTMASQSEM